MSNHLYRPERHRKEHVFPWLKVCLPLLLLRIVSFPFIQHFLREIANTGPWSEVSGRVLATRIVVAGIHEHAYRPGEIDYIVEAHVKYEKDGAIQDAWLPASERLSSRAELEFWLSNKKSELCVVRWNPKNPSLMNVVLN